MFVTAALSPLPLYFLVHMALAPMARTDFRDLGGWIGVVGGVIGLLELWCPYLILAAAACRRGVSRVAFALLIGGLIVDLFLSVKMATSGDGGGVPQGQLNAGIHVLLLLCRQYAFSITSVMAGLGLDWFVGARDRRTNATAEPSDGAESR